MMTDFCLLSLFIQHFSNKSFVGALAQPALKGIAFRQIFVGENINVIPGMLRPG
jgi:hypothetical protein